MIHLDTFGFASKCNAATLILFSLGGLNLLATLQNKFQCINLLVNNKLNFIITQKRNPQAYNNRKLRGMQEGLKSDEQRKSFLSKSDDEVKY